MYSNMLIHSCMSIKLETYNRQKYTFFYFMTTQFQKLSCLMNHIINIYLLTIYLCIYTRMCAWNLDVKLSSKPAILYLFFCQIILWKRPIHQEVYRWCSPIDWGQAHAHVIYCLFLLLGFVAKHLGHNMWSNAYQFYFHTFAIFKSACMHGVTFFFLSFFFVSLWNSMWKDGLISHTANWLLLKLKHYIAHTIDFNRRHFHNYVVSKPN